MKVTTQSSHAEVPAMVQSSQSIVRPFMTESMTGG
jgi:hypothetical protein